MLGLDQPARSKALGQKGICAQNYGIHFHHKLKLQKAQIHLKYAIKDVFLTSCKMLKNTIIIPKGEADFLTCYSFILFVTKFWIQATKLYLYYKIPHDMLKPFRGGDMEGTCQVIILI